MEPPIVDVPPAIAPEAEGDAEAAPFIAPPGPDELPPHHSPSLSPASSDHLPQPPQPEEPPKKKRGRPPNKHKKTPANKKRAYSPERDEQGAPLQEGSRRGPARSSRAKIVYDEDEDDLGLSDSQKEDAGPEEEEEDDDDDEYYDPPYVPPTASSSNANASPATLAAAAALFPHVPHFNLDGSPASVPPTGRKRGRPPGSKNKVPPGGKPKDGDGKVARKKREPSLDAEGNPKPKKERKPGSGRPKGSKNKSTLQKEAEARRRELAKNGGPPEQEGLLGLAGIEGLQQQDQLGEYDQNGLGLDPVANNQLALHVQQLVGQIDPLHYQHLHQQQPPIDALNPLLQQQQQQHYAVDPHQQYQNIHFQQGLAMAALQQQHHQQQQQHMLHDPQQQMHLHHQHQIPDPLQYEQPQLGHYDQPHPSDLEGGRL